MKEYLKTLLTHGLYVMHGRHLTRDYLAAHSSAVPECVIAIGKAAAAMAEGAYDMYGSSIKATLIITRENHVPESLYAKPGCSIVIGDHPIPGARSLAAGQCLLRFIAEQPAGRSLLCLISGGASALVEVLRPGISITDLHHANHWLLASGLDIASVNAVRKSLSAIKAGGLARQLHAHEVNALLLSDVAGDDPAVIGSGLLVADSRVPEILAGLDLPAWLAALSHKFIQAGDTLPVIPQIIGNNAMLVQALAERARNDGYHVIANYNLLSGDAQTQGFAVAKQLVQMPPALYIQGGETTVQLPANPGRGGRNTSLALAAACELAGRNDCWLLAAGSDGSDGTTEYAGAIVNGETISAGKRSGMDAAQYLSHADSAGYLEPMDALVHTGPTGTNVMDVVVGMRQE